MSQNNFKNSFLSGRDGSSSPRATLSKSTSGRRGSISTAAQKNSSKTINSTNNDESGFSYDNIYSAEGPAGSQSTATTNRVKLAAMSINAKASEKLNLSRPFTVPKKPVEKSSTPRQSFNPLSSLINRAKSIRLESPRDSDAKKESLNTQAIKTSEGEATPVKASPVRRLSLTTVAFGSSTKRMDLVVDTATPTGSKSVKTTPKISPKSENESIVSDNPLRRHLKADIEIDPTGDSRTSTKSPSSQIKETSDSKNGSPEAHILSPRSSFFRRRSSSFGFKSSPQNSPTDQQVPAPPTPPQKSPTASLSSVPESPRKSIPWSPFFNKAANAPPAPTLARRPSMRRSSSIKRDSNLIQLQDYSEEILKEVNILRTNTKEYISHLTKRLNSFVDELHYKEEGVHIKTFEGKKAITEAIEVLRTMKSVPAVTASSLLGKAALDHCKDMGDNDFVRHEGSDISTIQTRIEKYGDWKGYIGENIDCGFHTAKEIILHLLIDDNCPSRSHRKNLLNPSFLMIGAAIGPHPSNQVVCVMKFATKIMSHDESKQNKITEVRGISLSIMNEINEARRKPSKYAELLQQRHSSFIDEFVYRTDEGSFATKEGKKAVMEAIQHLKKLSPLPPLQISANLESAAIDYLHHLNKNVKDDSTTFTDFVDKYCYVKGDVACLKEYCDVHPRVIVMNLLVDDGLEKRLNRANLLSADYEFIGAAIGPYPRSEVMTVINLAHRVLTLEEHSTEKVVTIQANSSDIVTEINLLRTNPRKYLLKLQNHYDSFVGDTKVFRLSDGSRITTIEGKKAVKEAIDCLKALKPLPPMAVSLELERAAMDHVKDIGERTLRGHTGSDGSTIVDRIERYCVWQGCYGENIDYGSKSAEAIVISLFVDDGVSDRGHRHNLLEPDFLLVGSALGPYPEYHLKCTCVMDFAEAVVSLSDILHKNIKLNLKTSNDLNQEDVRKLCKTVPYKGNLYSELKGQLDAKAEIFIDFNATRKTIQISFTQNRSTRTKTIDWS